MHKLYRVFDRNNVIVPMKIRVINHRREGGRFTGPSGSSDQHESFFQHWKFFQNWRKAEVFHGQHLRWNRTERGRNAVLLLEEIHTVTHDVRHFVAKIDIE